MADGLPLPPKPPRTPGVPPLPVAATPPLPPGMPSIKPPGVPLPGAPAAGVKKETVRLAPPPKPAIPGAPVLPKPPIPAIPGAPAVPKPNVPSLPGATTPPAAPVIPEMGKPPADLRKETMRISLPPRPGGAGAKPTAAAATMAMPAPKAPMPGTAPAAKPGVPQGGASAATATPKAPGAPTGAKPAIAAPIGVRTVVDTDSAGTALAIAALVASLISFGVVLMSFLQK